MENGIDTTGIGERIQILLDENELAHSKLSTTLFGSPDRIRAFTDPKRRVQKPDLAVTYKVAKYFNVNRDWLEFGKGSRTETETSTRHSIPLLGDAAGSMAGKIAPDDPVEFVESPPALREKEGIYCVRVTGDSMEPRYSDQDIVFVDPSRNISVGDYVIAQHALPNGREAYIKQFRGENASSVMLKQLNPDGMIYLEKVADVILHRVLTNRELFPATD